MLMPELQRITTEYVDSEDRIRLCGEVAPNQAVLLWLTQRLLNRLVPYLLGWLEQQVGGSSGESGDVHRRAAADTRAEVVNGFAQQAAIAAMEQQSPVQAHTAQTAWLVHTVDVTVNQQFVRLTFKGPPGTAPSISSLEAGITMHALPLRQWLSILHEQCHRAGWVPTSPEAVGAVWPEWIQARHTDNAGGVALLH